MSFLGADVEELQDAGKKCEEGAQTADEVITFLKALVLALKAASFFTGGASAAYATYLETVVIPWLQKVSQALHLFAKVLNAHADAQNKTSAGESVDLGSLPTYQTPGGLPTGNTSSYPPIVAPTTGTGATPTAIPSTTPATAPAGGSGVTTTIAPDGTTTVHVDTPAATTPAANAPGAVTGTGTGTGTATGTATPTYATAPAGALGAGHAAGSFSTGSGGGSGSALGGGSGSALGGGSGAGGALGGGSAGSSGADGTGSGPSSVSTGGGVPGGSPSVDSSATYSGHYQPGDPGAASTAAGMTGDTGGHSSAIPMTAGALGAAGALGLGGAALAAKGQSANDDTAINALIDANGRGSKGNDVAELQKKLTADGYDTDGVDGVWGSKTQAAVDAYQGAHPVAVSPGQGHFSPTGYDYNKITGAQKANLSPEFYRKVEQVAANVGTKPEYLMGVISAETNGTFSAAIKNPTSTATGLIQFTKDTAHGLGTSTEALKAMTPVQQLDYVQKYLAPHRGHLGSVEGLYSTVLAGHTVENPDGVLLTQGAHNGYEGNHYLDQPGADGKPDGQITSREAADSIRARIRR